MATIGTLLIHGTEGVRVSEHEVKGTAWLKLSCDDVEVAIFDVSVEDLRGALYRYDMERYDANE